MGKKIVDNKNSFWYLQYLCDGDGAQRPLPITADAHGKLLDAPLDSHSFNYFDSFIHGELCSSADGECHENLHLREFNNC